MLLLRELTQIHCQTSRIDVLPSIDRRIVQLRLALLENVPDHFYKTSLTAVASNYLPT